MLTAISRAYRKKHWIVATVWSPHWLWQKWDMRYLKDPKGALGGEEHIHAFASKQFAGKFPRAATFFTHFKLDRKSVVSGKRVSVSLDLGGGRIYKKKKKK